MLKPHVTDVALFREHLSTKFKLADSSIALYTKIVSSFLSKPDLDLESVDGYIEYIVAHSIKKTCYPTYYALKHFVEWKIKDNNLKKEIIMNMKARRPSMAFSQRKRRYLDNSQLLEIINNLEEERHRIVAMIQMITGARVGDIFRTKDTALTSDKYKRKDGTFKEVLKITLMGKGNKPNVVTIFDEEVQKMIMDFIRNSNPLEIVDGYIFLRKPKYVIKKDFTEFHFCANNWHHYTVDLKQAVKMAGYDPKTFSSHSFRYLFARRNWDAEKDMQTLQMLMRHSRPETTMRYLNQTGANVQEAQRRMQEDFL